MKRIAVIGISAMMLCGLFGCGKKVPKEIIQPQAMENLLYDYHLATTLSADLPYSENYKKEAYLAYVFKKHHVTEAEFDSSMAWYSRHSDEMSNIYQNLQKRMNDTSDRLKKQVARHSGEMSVSLSGDTVDLWQDRTIYWLTPAPLTNKAVFDLKADTSFHPKDNLVLEAHLSFMPAGKMRGKVVMGLNVTFDKDSVQGITRVVSGSGMQRLFLRPDSAFKFKNVSGFMYYSGAEKSSVLLSGIQLMRYRVHETPAVNVLDSVVVPVDSLHRDSLRRDSLPRIQRARIMRR